MHTAELKFDSRPSVIEATGVELVRLTEQARAGKLVILALSVVSNGRYQVRMMNTARAQIANPTTAEAQ